MNVDKGKEGVSNSDQRKHTWHCMQMQARSLRLRYPPLSDVRDKEQPTLSKVGRYIGTQTQHTHVRACGVYRARRAPSSRRTPRASTERNQTSRRARAARPFGACVHKGSIVFLDRPYKRDPYLLRHFFKIPDTE